MSYQSMKEGAQVTHVSRATCMYDVPITSANTFNKVNVCLGLAISGYQPLERG